MLGIDTLPHGRALACQANMASVNALAPNLDDLLTGKAEKDVLNSLSDRDGNAMQAYGHIRSQAKPYSLYYN
ncbi:MAG: hypothetical protein V4605_08580 [Pseudomonadota bacterium]